MTTGITGLPRIAIAMTAVEYAEAIVTFRDTFGMAVIDMSDQTVPDLGAHVGICQPVVGSNIELMAPADPSAPLGMAMQRFLDRRGTGLYALMLEADDPDDEAAAMADRGLHVLPLMAGAGGRDVHPKSTHGVLIRVYPTGSVAQPSDPVSGPPHLTGIVRALLAVRNLAAATHAWGHGLGLSAGAVEADADRGVQSVPLRPPWGATVELVTPHDTTRLVASEIERHLGSQGEGLVALVLETPDVAAASDALRSEGIEVIDGPLGAEVRLFGARFVLQPTSV